jgi:formamidopyrimidine-DNA glycosylase
MPELPEVETMRRGIAGVAGRRIAGVTFPRSRVRPISVKPGEATLARRLAGRTVAGVHRRGKRIVIEIAAGAGDVQRWLAFEPRMTGQLLVTATGDQGSGILSSMSSANCFIVLGMEVAKLEAGSEVQVQLFELLM